MKEISLGHKIFKSVGRTVIVCVFYHKQTSNSENNLLRMNLHSAAAILYLHRSGIGGPDGQQSVSVGGDNSAWLQGLGLDGAAVHVESGGLVLHAEGDLVPPQVHQGFHRLAVENAAHLAGRGVGAPGTQGQGAVGAAEVHGELGFLEERREG